MRRMQRNTGAVSVSNGDYIVPQSSGSAHLKVTSGEFDVVSVTFSTDTNAYASGDLIADTQTMGTVADREGGRVILDSLTLIDQDAQGAKIYIFFHSTSTSMGTENSAPNISDANLIAGTLGYITVLTTDYVTISGAKVATLRNLGLVLECAAASQTLYVSILNETGTPTYTAAGLVGLFGFRKA